MPRSFAERTAVNTPLQGTAADLIKMAMIRIDRELHATRQPSADAAAGSRRTGARSAAGRGCRNSQLVKHEMESVYSLDVPLMVDVGTGPNWRDAK